MADPETSPTPPGDAAPRSRTPKRTVARPRGRPPRGTEGDVTARILDAARQTFLTHGFEAASLEAVAVTAGISKRTFYTRFASKADLFEAVGQCWVEEVLGPVHLIEDGPEPIAERLYVVASAMLANALTPELAQFLRILASEATRFPDLNLRVHEFGQMRAIARIERCLAVGVARGEIAVDETAFAAEHFCAAAIRAPLMDAVFGLDAAELTDAKRAALRRTVHLFLRGCGPGP